MLVLLLIVIDNGKELMFRGRWFIWFICCNDWVLGGLFIGLFWFIIGLGGLFVDWVGFIGLFSGSEFLWVNGWVSEIFCVVVGELSELVI